MRRVLRLGGVAQDRPCEAIRGIEVTFREARERRGPIFDLPIRDGAAICHGYLERLAHDDMTNGLRETFTSARATPESRDPIGASGRILDR